MEIKIAANIRVLRKQRKLTQEQLAEALGVTVGAVSKWESGSSTPDITLIVSMAEFFETSVDVLLGYDWHSGSMGQAAELIKTLRNEKRFDDAVEEAEKALKKYPNSFDITFQSAIMYCMNGLEHGHQKMFRRSLALYERALELISQNTDEHVSEWTIRNDIANVYMNLGQTKKGLELLKKNNAGGLNEGVIGFVLASGEHQPDEAMPYLTTALLDALLNMYRCMLGFANAYADKGQLAVASDALVTMRNFIVSLKREGVPSYLDMLEVQILSGCVDYAFQQGDLAAVRKYLTEAKSLARRFDANPVYQFSGMKFFHGGKNPTAFSDFGTTALDGLYDNVITVGGDETHSEQMQMLWDEIE